jgi:hypothetical protein
METSLPASGTAPVDHKAALLQLPGLPKPVVSGGQRACEGLGAKGTRRKPLTIFSPWAGGEPGVSIKATAPKLTASPRRISMRGGRTRGQPARR